MSKLLFSEVLQACLVEGTESVVSKLLQICPHPDGSREDIKSNHNKNNNARSNDNDSSENEYHSNEEKDSQPESSCDAVDDDESDSASEHSEVEMHDVTTDNQQSPSPSRREVDLSLHVESMVADSRINCNFPSPKAKRKTKPRRLMFGEHLKVEHSRYLPSTFQSAVLSHCEWQRKLVGHRIGLVIMATAMGKTILAIFDIEKELEDIHSTFGIDYGIQCDSTSNSHSNSNGDYQSSWSGLQCPCSVHDVVENEMKVSVPRTLDRMTYASFRSMTNPQIQKTEIVPFRLLFIVHTKAIRNGAFFKFKQHFQSIYGAPNRYFVKLESSTTTKEVEAAKFIFVLFQSFDRLKSIPSILKTVTHVIIDEVHHLLADTWLDVHRSLRSPSICPSLQYYLGMTATLRHRTDVSGDRLKSLFNNIVYIDFPWTTAKELGFFPAVEYLEALPTLSRGRDAKTYTQFLDEFRNDLSGNMNKSQFRRSRILNRFLSNLDSSLRTLRIHNDGDIKRTLTPDYVVRKLLQYQTMRLITNQEVKRRILIFANNAKDASKIADLCNVNGLRAGAIHYKVAAVKCEQILDGFANGSLSVLVNVNVVNEGYDLPAVDCVVMARLTSSEIIFVQQLGRGLRRDPQHPGKEICILDLALNLRRRWKVLQDTIPDQQVIDFILQFWSISNFVGNPVTMSPAK